MDDYMQILTDKVAAIDGSINKWKKIYYEDAEDGARSDCPLCQISDCGDLKLGTDCASCPIYLHTNKKNCLGTPYRDFSHLKYFGEGNPNLPEYLVGKTCKSIEHEMLIYLYELRTWYISCVIHSPLSSK